VQTQYYFRNSFIAKVPAKVNTRNPVYSIWSYTRMYGVHSIHEAMHVIYVIILNMKNKKNTGT
jgi:hypothetical protein